MGHTVNTVTGTIPTSELGVTLTHEHVAQYDNSMLKCFPGWFDEEIFAKKFLIVAERTKKAGIRTLVDMTNINMGRDVRFLKHMSERSGLQIVASTGVYFTEETWEWDISAERIAEYFCRDIEVGCEGSDIKAGILKCATDAADFSPINVKQLRATAISAKRTGVPISTHTIAARKHGLEQIRIFDAEGADLSKVVIGHSGDTNDLDYIEEMLKAGVYIGLDRFGSEFIFPEEDRINNLLELLHRGWVDRLFLSHDLPYFLDRFVTMEEFDKQDPFDRIAVYTHIHEDVLPVLRERGVSEDEINTMFVKNPMRLFNGNYED